MDSESLEQSILAALNHAPQWVRDDFAAKDPLSRQRAVEALSARILAQIDARKVVAARQG